MSKLVSLLASVAVFLAGCTLIPKYTRPEPPIQTQWPTGTAYEKAYTEGSAPADLPWRSYFTDPRLQALIETGLQNNRDLRTAALNVERARALYRVQQAELLPAVDASGQMLRGRVPGTLNEDDRSHTLKHCTGPMSASLYGKSTSSAASAASPKARCNSSWQPNRRAAAPRFC